MEKSKLYCDICCALDNDMYTDDKHGLLTSIHFGNPHHESAGILNICAECFNTLSIVTRLMQFHIKLTADIITKGE